MDATELERLKDFVEKHRAERTDKSNFLLSATGTGIGTNYRIICLNCDKAQDISDYECW